MKALLSAEQEASLVEAIRQQELRTSAELRVCITYKRIWRHQRFAWRLFDKMGMRNTRHRNAALIVMMPRVKRVVIIGDSGLDAILPPGYWEEAVAAMVRRMQSATPLEALLEGIGRLGETLTTHWPRTPDDVNELPDELLR